MNSIVTNLPMANIANKPLKHIQHNPINTGNDSRIMCSFASFAYSAVKHF